MFGKNKDEETEYINDYGNSDCFANSVDEEGLKELFRPYLEEDEEILYVKGSGNFNAPKPFESEKFLDTGNKFNKIKKIITIFFIVGFVISLLGSGVLTAIGAAMILPGIIFSGLLPVFIIASVIFIFVKCFKSYDNNANYAITNRRIINYSYGQWQEMSYSDVFDTSARITSGNKGEVAMKAKRINGGEEYLAYVVWTIKNVEDPLRVKYMLDQAIDKYKANNYQG